MTRSFPLRRSERPNLAAHNFDQAPFLVIWEMTQACDLACLHCRASARPQRDPHELTTAEAKRLMAMVRGFGRSLFVMTGGDPLKRSDTTALVAYGTQIGLRVALAPSGTPLMTPSVLTSLRDAGLARLAVSLDGSTADIHDRFRGVPGSFDWTVRMLHAARDLGLSTQVNTTISRHNLDDLEPLIALMRTFGVVLWSVFFVVPTGRARHADLTDPGETETVLHRLYDLATTAPFDIKTTAATHYRRVIVQRQLADQRAHEHDGAPAPPRGGIGFTYADGVGRGHGVNDGNGLVFVSHRGDICPSGFLPISAGNIRTHELGDVYRTHPLFRTLRDPDRLTGKCGACAFRRICGGSRARAYAMTGDYLAADPLCAYLPPAYTQSVAAGAPL